MRAISSLFIGLVKNGALIFNIINDLIFYHEVKIYLFKLP
ncbi:hypothetical protein HMPREF0201_01837 [Cedecea davisae DSM 4568]|uniref:Uncharacterized protein n=1 Tax=Cedecea davisae DSM 4568 TaxID=566551 RepID=S3IVU3_9ENTR|nr:hypothetical protein HMPREF0201_01837 [Cedecea davisae DSM 4568]